MVALLYDTGHADTEKGLTSPHIGRGDRDLGAEHFLCGVGHSTHMRTGLMAFLMLPKAARPSSSRRHLSASSAGFSFSFSGAWRGEGDRLWRQSHTGKGRVQGWEPGLSTYPFLFRTSRG